MSFFDKYDFFCFQLFGTDITFIFDENFLKNHINDKTMPSVPFLHYHETWELYCILDGDIKLKIGGEKAYDISAGQFMLIPPYTQHCITSYATETIHLSIRIFISNASNERNDIVNRLLSANSLVAMNLDASAITDLQLIQTHYTEYKGSQKKNIWCVPKISSYSMHFFTDILSRLGCAGGFVPDDNTNYQKFFHPMLIEVLMACDNESKLSISQLASNLNYSVEQTHRIIKQRLGKSFRTLVYEIRMEKAKAYLTQTDLSIEEISEALGFKAAKNFHASFKASEGLTPTEYRKKFAKSSDALHTQSREL